MRGGFKYHCPACESTDTKVVLTRTTEKMIIRRRLCENTSCKHRWYTSQYPEATVSDAHVQWLQGGRTARINDSQD